MGVLKKEKVDGLFDECDLAFKFSFLILCFINFNAFTFGEKIASVFVVISLLFAGASLVGRIWRYKHFATKTFFLLVAFLASYVVSLLLTFSYGFITPVKTLVWMALELFLLFLTDNRKSKEKQRREIKWLFTFYNAVVFLSSAASLYFVCSQTNNVRFFESIRVVSGFIWGRLWGVYTDPNYGAVMANIAILISAYFIMTNPKWWIKILNAINIVVQVAYICFSDSRTGQVALFASVFVYVLLQMLKTEIRVCKPAKVVCALVLAFLLGVSALAMVSGMKKGYNVVVTYVAEQNAASNKPNTDSDKEMPSDVLLDPPSAVVGREDDTKNDISNRRFGLWRSGLETVMTRPVFGISFNNLVPYVKEHLPQTYLVNNDHGVFSNYHNSLISILVGQGFVGFAIFCALAVALAVKSIRCLAQQHDKGTEQLHIVAFSIVVATLMSSLFLQELAYTLSTNTYMFWLLLGVLASGTIEEEKEQL